MRDPQPPPAHRRGHRAPAFWPRLAFYTRLNNLIMAAGVALFALPLRVPLSAICCGRPSGGGASPWRTVVIVAGGAWPRPAVVRVAQLALHAALQRRSTARSATVVAIWQPGVPLAQSLRRLVHSVMLVLTVNDPPRFDLFALPILAGALVAVLSVAGVPRLRDLPAAAVLFFFASIAGAFVAAGWAYTGRFSIHVMPVTCALAACGAAQVVQTFGPGRPATVDRPAALASGSSGFLESGQGSLILSRFPDDHLATKARIRHDDDRSGVRAMGLPAVRS